MIWRFSVITVLIFVALNELEHESTNRLSSIVIVVFIQKVCCTIYSSASKLHHEDCHNMHDDMSIYPNNVRVVM